jgi:hypothetical protein
MMFWSRSEFHEPTQSQTLLAVLGDGWTGLPVLLLKLLQLDTAGVARPPEPAALLRRHVRRPGRFEQFDGAGAKTGERGAFSGVCLIGSVHETIDLKNRRMYGRHRPFTCRIHCRRPGELA